MLRTRRMLRRDIMKYTSDGAHWYVKFAEPESVTLREIMQSSNIFPLLFLCNLFLFVLLPPSH
jgi:hypothetical protein